MMLKSANTLQLYSHSWHQCIIQEHWQHIYMYISTYGWNDFCEHCKNNYGYFLFNPLRSEIICQIFYCMRIWRIYLHNILYMRIKRVIISNIIHVNLAQVYSYQILYVHINVHKPFMQTYKKKNWFLTLFYLHFTYCVR